MVNPLSSSSFRFIIVAIISLLITFTIYERFTNPGQNQSLFVNTTLKNLSYIVWLITFVSTGSIVFGIWKFFTHSQSLETKKDTKFYMTLPFKQNKNYITISIISAILYGIFFCFLSQVLIYSPDRNLDDEGIKIPSVNITPCCNLPGYVPILTVYLTNHFVILLIPLNVLLVAIVSVLIGINISIGIFAIKASLNYFKNNYAIGTAGATFGLFMGCPTCAGSIFASLFGFGAGTTLAVLSQFQTIFILVSIPSLIISPILFARKMNQQFCKL